MLTILRKRRKPRKVLFQYLTIIPTPELYAYKYLHLSYDNLSTKLWFHILLGLHQAKRYRHPHRACFFSGRTRGHLRLFNATRHTTYMMVRTTQLPHMLPGYH